MYEPTLDRLLDEAAGRHTDHDALIYGESAYTYGQVAESVNRLAKALMRLGVKNGNKVGIWMPDNEAWICSYFAAAKIGAVIVPINARYRSHDVKYILRHGEISTLIVSDLAPHIQDYVRMVYEALPTLGDQNKLCLSLEDFPNLKNVISVGDREHEGFLRFNDVMNMDVEVADKDLRERQSMNRRENLATIQYTSGTTSFPKGCMLTHEIVVRNALYCADRLEVREERDVFLDVMPPFHVVGICFGLLPSLAFGCCRIGVDHFNPLEALKWIEKKRCTVHSGMGMMIKAELDHPEFKKHDVSSLRTGICAGPSSVFQQIKRLVPNWKPLNIYGLSEVGGNLTTTKRDDPPEVAWYTHGTPHDGLEVKIADPDTGRTLNRGFMGEICARGWSIMKGYYRDPEASAKTVDRDGWLHTGDKGKIDNDGRLVYVGRIKDTIKVGGENVAPQEIEDFLMQHPKVQCVQALGIEDLKLTEVVAVFVELKPNEHCTEDELIRFCQGKIASFKMPRYIRFVKTWPLSATKVQKFRLREQLENELKVGAPPHLHVVQP
ncbi:MAG: AMP-binding protein [Thermodesulfobacteriota bacterium]